MAAKDGGQRLMPVAVALNKKHCRASRLSCGCPLRESRIEALSCDDGQLALHHSGMRAAHLVSDARLLLFSPAEQPRAMSPTARPGEASTSQRNGRDKEKQVLDPQMFSQEQQATGTQPLQPNSTRSLRVLSPFRTPLLCGRMPPSLRRTLPSSCPSSLSLLVAPFLVLVLNGLEHRACA